jgi:hypothetical protein
VAERPTVADINDWNGGQDSTLGLHLVRRRRVLTHLCQSVALIPRLSGGRRGKHQSGERFAANARAGLKVVSKLFLLALDTVGDAYCPRLASNRPSAATDPRAALLRA